MPIVQIENNSICLEDLLLNATNIFVGHLYAVVFCDSLETFPLARVSNDLRANRLISYDTDIVAAKVLNPNQIKIVRGANYMLREM